ncbi:MAG: phosphatase PAP2 family protein [Actinomycetota bacterium]|nr:phosphatase PAP2 family protein [Actinomycetota bacterium]
MTDTLEDPRPPARARLRWWRELLCVVAFYSVYTLIRNHGVATGSHGEAFRHARQVIGAQRLLGIYHEETIQDLFLAWKPFISFWNVFYGTAHFFVTIGALVYLFRRMPERYPLWRNTLALTTGLALVGFVLYPLMPPRLLPGEYGFVDTLRVVGGLWSFESAPMAKVSNPYAAMPSLHVAWAGWCSLALSPALARPWARRAMVAYPVLTLFAVVVTANHFLLDALGSAVVLGAGFWLARLFTGWIEARGTVPESLPGVPPSSSASAHP